MDHYVEIRILPDPEFPSTILMNAIYGKLHSTFVQLQNSDIGVSFPSYDAVNKQLGFRLRLHGSKNQLEDVMKISWLSGLHDYIRVGSVSPIPKLVNLMIFKRVQAKSNAERIRRRQMRRQNLTQEEISECFLKAEEKRLLLPFVSLKSQSSKQTFRLYIQTEVSLTEVKGLFNTYGLSKTATVPVF